VVIATRVAALPFNIDIASMSTTGVAKMPHRVEHVVRLRRALLTQLRREAESLGAAGVVGVRFIERPFELASQAEEAQLDAVELAATGLAVVTPGPLLHSRQFTTTASPAAFATMLRGGYLPADVLIAGVTRLRQSGHVGEDSRVLTQRRNGEVPGQTQMIQAGRRAVVARLQATAQQTGADGVLVAAFASDWSPRHSVVQVSAVGDAIVRLRDRGLSAAAVVPMT